MTRPTQPPATPGAIAVGAPGTGTEESEPTAASRMFLTVAGDEVYATYSLPATGALVIGRAPEVDIQIDHPSISRRHARLALDPLSLTDLGSVNGTFVDEGRLAGDEPVAIAINQAVRLGTVTLLVQRRARQARTRRVHDHAYFENRLDEECARAQRNGERFAVAQVILDKPADQPIGAALAAALRDSDVVATYSPTELVVLLVHTDPAQVERVMGRLARAVEEQGYLARTGAAWYPGDGRDASALCGAARDRARGGSADDAANGLVVSDARMVGLHALVDRVAGADISVLLLGETGVGKEVIAETIHRKSTRAAKPFLRLNCAALTETLLESELFGYERGAFTGATGAKPGLLETADGGVVFLDEIGELPLSMQVKLLRVLDERKVLRVGGLKPKAIDVRLISATNRDLEVEVERGTFRRDLLYRLNAMAILIPPLRERPDEVVSIAQHFVKTLSTAANRPTPRLTPAALQLLVAYHWPGNVRELRNVIERALVLCSTTEITPRDLPEERMRSVISSPPMGATYGAATAQFGPSAANGYGRMTPPIGSARPVQGTGPYPPYGPSGAAAGFAVSRGGLERDRIVEALAACAGNQTHAAQMLGVSRRTLINWIEKHQIARPRRPRRGQAGDGDAGGGE